MYIAKLQYQDKETAIADLISKDVYTEELVYGQGIHAIVEIGKVVKVQGTYDEDGNVITEPIYYDGYAYDVMSEQEIDFGINEIQVNNPKHNFAGYEQRAI